MGYNSVSDITCVSSFV